MKANSKQRVTMKFYIQNTNGGTSIIELAKGEEKIFGGSEKKNVREGRKDWLFSPFMLKSPFCSSFNAFVMGDRKCLL